MGVVTVNQSSLQTSFSGITSNSLIADTLEVAVPLRIMELKQVLNERGNDVFISVWEEWTNPERANLLGVFSEALLFRQGAAEGETAAAFNALAQAIAALSYVPGGVRVFGSRWESTPTIKAVWELKGLEEGDEPEEGAEVQAGGFE